MTRILLHIGAHKTASTHFQRSCYADVERLRQLSAVFFGPQELRGEGGNIPERFGFPLDASRHASLVTDPLAQKERMLDGAQTLILSEENFAGSSYRRWGKIPTPLYQDVPKRIVRLCHAVREPLELLLSVRHPCDFLSSIYSQILLTGQKIILPEEFLERNDPLKIDWLEYVLRLHALGAVKSLRVWPFESYPAVFPSLMNSIFGSDGRSIRCETITHLPRLSEVAVGKILSHRVLDKPREGRKAIAERFPITADNPKLELFSRDEYEAVSVQYQRQLSAIAKLEKVEYLS